MKGCRTSEAWQHMRFILGDSDVQPTMLASLGTYGLHM